VRSHPSTSLERTWEEGEAREGLGGRERLHKGEYEREGRP
jgi:hypothetical protein